MMRAFLFFVLVLLVPTGVNAQPGWRELEFSFMMEHHGVEVPAELLQAHVVEGTDDSAMVMSMDGQALTTLAGTELTITVDGDTVMVGDATVVDYDVMASNGIIHVIDTVLAPSAG